MMKYLKYRNQNMHASTKFENILPNQVISDNKGLKALGRIKGGSRG